MRELSSPSLCSRVASTAKTMGWCELTHPRQAAQSPSVVAVRLVHVRAWAGPFTRILKRVPGKICHDERDTQKYEVERPVPLPMRRLLTKLKLSSVEQINNLEGCS